MRDIVAIAALGETSQHTSRMRCTMAALAGRDSLVFVFVAGNTVDALMLGICLAVQLKGLLVTCSTHLVGSVGRISNGCWHVCLVATLAISSRHIRTVRFVALGTERNLAVNIVAETASKAGMFAFYLFQLDDLLSVAGNALIGDIVSQFDNFWSMWVVVATKAAGKIVVWLAAMALAADRDYFFNCRWVTGMTILAADLGFVSSTIGCNSLWCRLVTFNTI